MREFDTLNILRKGSKVNLRFISLLAVVILLQQFAFASLHHSLFFNGSRHGQLHYQQKQPVGQDAFLLNADVEETEEDEVRHPEQRSECDLFSVYAILERIYASGINCTYIDLAYGLESRDDLPLFLLHHSWKAHLS